MSGSYGLLTVACLALAACGGGGGSGGNATTVGTPDPVNPAPPSSSPGNASETAANYGVAKIGADTAFAQGARGAGVKVAVIDSGISLDHPEFVGRIDRRASIDIVTGNAGTLEDESGHGSHVAGVIAANADGKGMRGIAPRSTLLVLRADLRDDSVCDTPGCGYFDSDVASALDYARRQNADIVNLSIGKDTDIDPAYRTALKAAIREGSLVVAAAGNRQGDKPLAPGRFAGDDGLAGGMLVVGAVDKNNNIFADTGRAGSVADYFLVAPGVDIYSTYRNGTYARLTGTSMATPHVSGAAAVLKSAFPSLSMKQVAAILLQTADDLGAAGVDPIYGRGLVNLARALEPVGQPQLALEDSVDGIRQPVADTSLSLGAAFGDALSGEKALSQAIALDDFARPYAANLDARVQRPRGGLDLDRLLIDQRVTHDLPLTAIATLGVSGALAIAEDRQPLPTDGTRAAFVNAIDTPEQRFERLALASHAGPIGDVEGGLGLAPSEIENGLANHPADGLFLDAQGLLSPVDAVIDRGAGLRLSLPFVAGGSLHLGLLESDQLRTSSADGEDRPGRLLSLGTDHRIGDSTNLQLRYSHIDESAGLLGSTGSGAFAIAKGALTQLGTARLTYEATGEVAIFAQATLGMSKLEDEMGLIRDWSGVRSEAFAVGLIAADIMQDGDRLGIVIGQPLRVAAASATLDVPVARDLEGEIQRRRDKVDMTPSGRELRLELAYRRHLDEDQTLSTWLLLQRQPGHDRNAEPAAGLGIRWIRRL